MGNNNQSIDKSSKVEEKDKLEVKKEEVKLSYKVYGQDFSLTDTDFIDYYRTRMKIMAMRFMLVGRINDKGYYKIKDQIKYDLINMVKEISDEDDDFIRADSYFMKKFFYFKIKIIRDEKKAKAELYLSEFVDNFLDEEYITSHIADFEDVNDENFISKVKEAFNLHDVALKNNEMKIPNLAVLMQDEYDINKYIGGLYDIASQIYLMRMLKLLEESQDEVCLDIIRRYKELIVDIEGDEENPLLRANKYTYLKAILDRVIDEKGGLEKLKLNKDKLKNIVQEINKSVKAIDGLQVNPAAIELLRTDNPVNKKIENKSGDKTKSVKRAGKKGSSKKNENKEKAKKSSSADNQKKKTETDEETEKTKKDLAYGYNPYKELKKDKKNKNTSDKNSNKNSNTTNPNNVDKQTEEKSKNSSQNSSREQNASNQQTGTISANTSQKGQEEQKSGENNEENIEIAPFEVNSISVNKEGDEEEIEDTENETKSKRIQDSLIIEGIDKDSIVDVVETLSVEVSLKNNDNLQNENLSENLINKEQDELERE